MKRDHLLGYPPAAYEAALADLCADDIEGMLADWTCRYPFGEPEREREARMAVQIEFKRRYKAHFTRVRGFENGNHPLPDGTTVRLKPEAGASIRDCLLAAFHQSFPGVNRKALDDLGAMVDKRMALAQQQLQAERELRRADIAQAIGQQRGGYELSRPAGLQAFVTDGKTCREPDTTPSETEQQPLRFE